MGRRPVGGIFSVGLEEPYRWKDSVQSEPEIRLWVAEGTANGMRPWFAKFAGVLRDRRWLPVVERIYGWHHRHERYLRNTASLARVALIEAEPLAKQLHEADHRRHAVAEQMARQGSGSIVNVSSISALRPRGLTTYSVSKGAVIALTRAMAVDHGRDGIRVNCVAPGPVYTPMVYARGMSEAARQRRRQASVLGIEGTGWDIGHAVRFLLSDHARYITGHVLVVDGGTTLTAPERDYQDETPSR